MQDERSPEPRRTPGPQSAAGPRVTPGAPAPDYRAPSNKGHTLGPDAFADHLAVTLVFFGGFTTEDDRARIWPFDALLAEFGRRRVQLLGVVPATARALRDATGTSALTLLADGDGSIGAAFGIAQDEHAAVLVDRHGTVAAVLEGEDVRPERIIAAVDRCLEQRPDAFAAHPGGHDR